MGDSASTNESYSSSYLFPQTIEDAITVALQVGINFLWVDRYCLPQQECPEKREQIQKMHKIYREADLTIIAAAGDGPDYGLPGISTPRSPQAGVHKKLSETRDGRLELGHFKRALFQEGSSSSLYGA
ncbi:hypothetical protein FOZG_13321 [Fusarium oxysporum Fo47]|uniref:Heterokaryon incompatibility domain-containing protein n=1 Tax=Fusarium oxysporum Fo47 TaxID=660027 RepID=W9JSU9_FUSOX|nr:hypothetical protein FOZG_13321 [Fusarium oxysporum Fo47]